MNCNLLQQHRSIGVVPGRGICPGPDNSRRLTFMVGFWEEIQSVTRGVDCPGPGQPYPGRHTAATATATADSPPLESRYTWPAEMVPVPVPELEEMKAAGGAGGTAERDWVAPIPIPTVWESVNEDHESEGKANSTGNIISAHYDTCFQGF
jgi:hypothetical protein